MAAGFLSACLETCQLQGVQRCNEMMRLTGATQGAVMGEGGWAQSRLWRGRGHMWALPCWKHMAVVSSPHPAKGSSINVSRCTLHCGQELLKMGSWLNPAWMPIRETAGRSSSGDSHLGSPDVSGAFSADLVADRFNSSNTGTKGPLVLTRQQNPWDTFKIILIWSFLLLLFHSQVFWLTVNDHTGWGWP